MTAYPIKCWAIVMPTTRTEFILPYTIRRTRAEAIAALLGKCRPDWQDWNKLRRHNGYRVARVTVAEPSGFQATNPKGE